MIDGDCSKGMISHPVIVADVEAASSRVSSISQISIGGFGAGAEIFAYEALVIPREECRDLGRQETVRWPTLTLAR
jgi:hypothetical protein